MWELSCKEQQPREPQFHIEIINIRDMTNYLMSMKIIHKKM